MQHSIRYLFNPNDFLKIRNRSTQTKINIFSDFCNLKKLTKTKQKQISKFEKKKKKNILIENPKTQSKNESNLNLPNKKTQLKVTFYTQTYKIEKKMYLSRCRFRRFDGLSLARDGDDRPYELCLLCIASIFFFFLSPSLSLHR